MREWWQNLPIRFAPDDEGAGGGGETGSGEGSGDDGGSLLDNASNKSPTGEGEGNQGGGEGDQGQGQTGEGEGAGPPKLVFRDKPDWLDPAFWDKETGEAKVEALAQSRQDLRAKLGKGDHKAPAKPEDYSFELSDSVKKVEDRIFMNGEDGSEDPVVSAFRGFAHERGLSNEVFSDIINWYGEQVGSLMPPPVDQKAELAKLGPDSQALIDVLADKGDRMKAAGLFSDAEVAEYRLICQTAAGCKVLAALISEQGEPSIPVMHQAMQAGTSDADALDAKMGQIVKDFQDGKITEAEAQRRNTDLQVDYEKLYGTASAGSSVVPR